MPLEFREVDERYLFTSDFKPSCEKIQDNGPSEDKYDILIIPGNATEQEEGRQCDLNSEEGCKTFLDQVN